jgi:hypothetical protein
MDEPMSRPKDCSVCLVAHDPEIHEATTRIHEWFRASLTRYIDVAPVKGDEEMAEAS